MGASFQAEVRAAMERQRTRLLNVAKAATVELVDEVLVGAAAPVDSGAFLGNMNASIGAADFSFNPGQTDNDGVPTAMKVREVIANLALGDVFYLSNGTPYGPNLEYGLYPNPPKTQTGKTVNGYSSQAPHGVFRVSIAKWKDIVFTAIDQTMTLTEAVSLNAPSFSRNVSFTGTDGVKATQSAKIGQATREFSNWSKKNNDAK